MWLTVIIPIIPKRSSQIWKENVFRQRHFANGEWKEGESLSILHYVCVRTPRTLIEPGGSGCVAKMMNRIIISNLQFNWSISAPIFTPVGLKVWIQFPVWLVSFADHIITNGRSVRYWVWPHCARSSLWVSVKMIFSNLITILAVGPANQSSRSFLS